MIYGFWLTLWYLVAIVLFVLWFTDSDYPFGIFKLFLDILYELETVIYSFHISRLAISDSWRVSLVGQDVPFFPERPSSPTVLSRFCVAQSLVVCVMFCRPLFLLLSFFFWHCLLFFDLRIRITPFTTSTFFSTCLQTICVPNINFNFPYS
jgi:hypothetical protein